MTDLSTEDIAACLREAGVPVLVPPWLAADLAAGLGIRPYYRPRHPITYLELAADFARRLRTTPPRKEAAMTHRHEGTV